MGRKKYSKELKSQIVPDSIKGQKTIAELASEYGVRANQISICKKPLLDVFPVAFSNGKDKESEKKKIELNHLYQKVNQLQIEVDWLKKDRISGMSVSEKVKCIDGNYKKLSIRQQCEKLATAILFILQTQIVCHLVLMRLIDEEPLRHPFYGTRKMKDYLNRKGFPVNRNRIQR